MAADQTEVHLHADDIARDAFLGTSPSVRGIVAFAHGSGSSRFSERNQYVASVLRDAGFGTLLLDLLTPAEERLDARTADLRFDIPLLARRMAGAVDWLRNERIAGADAIGLFGASTGAAAALLAAADRADHIAAVVSRGGRPDLAAGALARVRAPTLLIVGGFDTQVIALNREAFAKLLCEKRLEIVPGASHLFEEPGTLEAAASLARDWFLGRLHASDPAAPVP